MAVSCTARWTHMHLAYLLFVVVVFVALEAYAGSRCTSTSLSRRFSLAVCLPARYLAYA
jgi:hypothetical protein